MPALWIPAYAGMTVLRDAEMTIDDAEKFDIKAKDRLFDAQLYDPHKH